MAITATQKKVFYRDIAHRLSEAIKSYCFECSGFSKEEVNLCVIPNCPLHSYRKGVDLRGTISTTKGMVLNSSTPQIAYADSAKQPAELTDEVGGIYGRGCKCDD